MLEDQARAMKLCLEDRLGVRVPVDHPVMVWLVVHSSMLLTNFHYSGEDNLTGYERLHGNPAAQRMPEFGESVMWYVPKRLRHKLDPKWRVGCYMGRSGILIRISWPYLTERLCGHVQW